ncbi:dolichyldiphosphatase [Fusarium globosum]|uniref:Dolichyldiphosphatase n=1 Tax=Fusarium globosum TaxID=78864 RepID=A0A8H5YDD8_9HYPO|nr:dolichyldiphosphatase [Fusarium globosum]
MDDSSTPLASLSVTHVYYDPDDHISLACAYLALLPQALCVVYATLVLFTREVEVALMFLGQLACEVLNFALKRLIKEERPRRIHGKGYGMPSSHAQFVAFWSVSLALFLLVRHKPPRVHGIRAESSLHRPWSVLERVAVIVGSVAGVISALGWFIIVAAVRQTGWLKWTLETPLARAFRVRDLVIEEDMCQAGWEKWEKRRAAAQTIKKDR